MNCLTSRAPRGLRLNRTLPWFAALALATVSSAPGQSTPSRGYHRLPTLHGDTIVFTSEGDLWRAPVAGGVAQRLTTHPGVESHAVISSDGITIAFSAEYEGPTELYTMPLDGGLPVRRTFDGTRATPVGWTTDGRILFSTKSDSGLPDERLAFLDARTGVREPVPLAQASEGAWSEDGPTLYFTRLPWQGSSTKRYQGGTAENLWRYSFREPEAVPLTADFKGTSRNPMWWRGRLYFLSDRDGIMNVWSIRADGSDAKQHTHHRDYDVMSASLDNGRIAYQLGADLRVLELADDSDRLVPIALTSDFDQQRERWIKKPVEYLTSAHLSPKGDRVVLTARGQVFVAPVDPGRFVEVPRQASVRYRSARFLPDGKSLVALSDESRELEFWRLPANGLGTTVQLTTNGTIFRYEGIPSPDSNWLAYGDKNQRLWIHHLERRETRLVAESGVDTLTDFAWSPDSQWLAYAEPATNSYRQIKLFRPADNTRVAVTSDRVDSYDPAWSPDGKWLYLLSARELRSLSTSPWGPLQPEPLFVETTKIYQIALTNGLHPPFEPPNELVVEDAKKDGTETAETSDARASKDSKDGKDGAAGSKASSPDSASGSTNRTPAVTVSIVLDGLASRIHEVPVRAGNYLSLSVTPKHLLWMAADTSFDGKQHLEQLEITHKDPKPKALVEDIRSYEVSADGKRVLVRKGDDFHVIDADASAPAKLDNKLKLDGWTFSIQPREEWRQIFTEAWRMMRDYFYDRGMHQVDWPAMLQKYLPLVDRVSDRSELSDVLHQMVGELSTLHVFVRLGDERERPDRIDVATLGARLSRDEAGGGWRVEHIFRGEPDFPLELSPLARPNVDVKEGDVILSINGRPTLTTPHPSMLLRNQAGRQVLLEVKSRTEERPRRTIVEPISAGKDGDLRYDEWELTRRETVERLGESRIGYVHLRAMGPGNISEWARGYYPVFQRQGLIIDVRHNRGGNIDSWILGKLLRKAWFYWQPRVGQPIWNMQYAFRGHLVVLCDEFTASDGEAFTEGFRRLNLGKTIGTRTWGGEIWLSADRWLVDRGMATAAELGVYGPEGTWLIEGHGVDPDIVVDNLPHATFEGRDAQLEAAVAHLKESIEKDPRPVPPAPKYPDRSFRPK